ncbi:MULTISPECIES: hypothetical protein [unclassified Lentimicrobium]|uniref:hypothetical protein n=1 Tax=unclassified Lentimicrobium TaxID=2677434 RepID=UPI0015565648|nr:MULTISPECIES: hypothetical protein [unclassified Lentimicrobium]NPD46398.1 hypothetical protein [Lentimicrobium sp. S6]NPD83584.1 hypothetical protein [Lentimicrobium sp. L6]
MKKSILILIFILSTISIAYSYDCKTNLQYSEYERADYIFTGRIIEVNYPKGYYKVEVTENIKGSVDEIATLSMGNKYSSTIHPERFDFWLIYASKYKNDSLFADCCGHSLQLTGTQRYQSPPPPYEIIVDERFLLRKINRLSQNLTNNEEIISLRFHVQNEKIGEILNNQQIIISKLENDLFYQKGFAAILIILLVLLLFKKNTKP